MFEKITVKSGTREFDTKYVYNDLLHDFEKLSREKNGATEDKADALGVRIQELELGVVLALLNNGNVRHVMRELMQFADLTRRFWLQKLVVQAGVIAEYAQRSDAREIRLATPRERHYNRVDFYVDGRPVICRKDIAKNPQFAYYSDLDSNTVPFKIWRRYSILPDKCRNAYDICKRTTKKEPLIIVGPYNRCLYTDTHLEFVTTVVNDQ